LAAGGDGAIDMEDDTLELTIPEDTEERIERPAGR
jgi:hypothetical protein